MITLIKKLTLPILFIFLYGSGFVFTALGLQNSTPIAFLTLRFFIAFFRTTCRFPQKTHNLSNFEF